MPRRPMPWFRFYVETFADRKIRRLTPAQRWAWAAILGAARESPKPGLLYVADGLPMSVKELATYADVRLADARKALELCVAMEMVTVSDDGLVSVTNWVKRNPESDDVTARTRTHRERSKERDNPVPTNVPSNEVRNVNGTNSSRASARGEETEDREQTLEKNLSRDPGGERHLTLPPPDATDHPPTCSRHPNGNPTDQPCAGCARVRAWHEQQDEAERTRRRDELERARSSAVLGDLERAKRDATPPPADWRALATAENAKKG